MINESVGRPVVARNLPARTMPVGSASEATRPLPLRFALERRVDVSGVSGTGLVAFGTVYPTGRTTLVWCAGDVASVTVYDFPEQVEQIHGHDGKTMLVWIDAVGQSPARG